VGSSRGAGAGTGVTVRRQAAPDGDRDGAIDHLKAIYQVDPCSGSGWIETADIEEAVDDAAVRGRAYLGEHMITWSPGFGYSITQNKLGADQ